MKVFSQLMWFFKQEKKSYLFGILLIIFVSVLELIAPKVIGIIVDQIEKGTLTLEVLIKWLLLLLLTGITTYIVRFWWRVMIFGSSLKLARMLRNQLFEHFTKMSPQFYQRRRIGDLMAHATNDLQAIQMTAGAGVLTLVDSISMGGFVLLAMAILIDWKLTLISLIPMPIMAIATSKYGSMLHKRFHKAQAAFSTLNNKVQESVNGIRVIKSFGQEKEDIEAFRKQSEDVVEKNIGVAKIDALFEPTISLVVGTSFFLSIAFGSKFVLEGSLTIGELVAFTAYLGLLIWPMLAFGWLFNIVERGRASYDRVTHLLSEEVDIFDCETAITEEPGGAIQYQINTFTFPNDSTPTLKNINVQIKEGQMIGIVGKTGSGKTTMVKLLLREFDVKDGDIFIGNHAIREYRLDSLRRAIGYVPQDHFLFTATIADNIAFAKPDASISEIIKAAKLASIHYDIGSFPEGYETIVGERGVTLSGGQKQRISIARALITNPSILILDDSLSAVDAKTEEIILKQLKENRKGRTTIITAHRLSAIENADLILVLDQGEIIESGNHESLMKARGWYFESYKRQQLEAIVEHGG
jgi:ATP-binding cassette subfamily B multidrug efflux pump